RPGAQRSGAAPKSPPCLAALRRPTPPPQGPPRADLAHRGRPPRADGYHGSRHDRAPQQGRRRSCTGGGQGMRNRGVVTGRLFALALCGLAATACAGTAPVHGQAATPAAASVFDTLVWSDEFDTLDASNWSFETGGHGWGNNERQFYTDGANAFTQYDAMAGSRVLVIEARRGAPTGAWCWYGSCQYSSTRMVTRGKREFR